MTSRRWMRAFVLWAWSVAMIGLTLILAGVPLKSLRRGLGRSWFLAIGIATAVGLFAAQLKFLGVAYLSFVILIELFSEWEDLGLSLVASSFFSLLITTLFSGAAVAIWISRTGSQWKTILLERMEEWLKPALSLTPSVQVNALDILLQMPSIIIIIWLAVLYLTVLLEGRLTPPYREERATATGYRPELEKINIPHAMVWIFILSLAGAFGDFGVVNLQPISINILNICLMLFFFQGLAVIYRFFHVFRIGFFWQALLMIIVVGQLFLLVSLLGLVDHWVDFRTRLSKRREAMNKELQ